jgi:hypothetical protein
MMQPNLMNFENMLVQITQPKGWMISKDPAGNIQIVVGVKPGRTQVVNVTYGRDAEQASVAFFWSICAETSVIRDPLAILRANYNISYGAYTIKDPHLIIQDGVLVEGADPATVAKVIWHIARNADGYEEAVFGQRQRF